MTASEERQFRHRLLAICLGALALRLGIRVLTGTERYWIDGYGLYIQLAESLGQGRGYALPGQPPTAFRVPLYPLFIWAVTGGGHRIAWALIAASAAVSAGTAGLAGLIARRMAGPLAGLGAAALYAAWPYGAWHDVSLQESGLFAFLAALSTLALMIAHERRSLSMALCAGAMLGLAMLTRATLLPFTLGALAWLVLPAVGDRPLPRRAATALAALLAFALVLAPWLERAHRITGSYGLGTEMGQSLYAGNHPLTFSVYPNGSIDESRALIFAAHSPEERAELARLDEAGQDRWYRAKGLAQIIDNPGRFLTGAARKLWAAFGPWPVPRHGLLGDLGYMATWLPFLAPGLAGAAMRRREWRGPDGLLWWHFATFSLTTALFWAQTAHRSYLDPFIAVYGGIALARLVPALIARIRSRAS